jgi:hypothetical protein
MGVPVGIGLVDPHMTPEEETFFVVTELGLLQPDDRAATIARAPYTIKPLNELIGIFSKTTLPKPYDRARHCRINTT